jgi:hypothetical protein
MSGIMTKWSVLHEHTPTTQDLDGDGAVRDDVVRAWVDAACRAYLAQCTVLERKQASGELELQVQYTGAVPRLTDDLVAISATASEFFPDAFAVSIRVRSGDAAPANVTARVRLHDVRTGKPQDLGKDVRDELIALEHAARHYN